MLLQTLDRIAEWPCFGLFLRAITRRIIARRVRSGAIGAELDERRATAATGALRRPLSDGVHGKKVIAVHANTWKSIARPARRERALLAAREALERGDGPLIVDDVQDHRCLVDGAERECVMKIRFGATAFTDPARRERVLPFDRRGHRPAHRLRKLRR